VEADREMSITNDIQILDCPEKGPRKLDCEDSPQDSIPRGSCFTGGALIGFARTRPGGRVYG
jgi:hypothetical protein